MQGFHAIGEDAVGVSGSEYTVASGFWITLFGTPLVSRSELASGFLASSFGTPTARNVHRAASIGPITHFGAPTTPTNVSCAAAGWLTTEFGDAAIALHMHALDTDVTVQARWISSAMARFGQPTARQGHALQATGAAPATTFGTPTALLHWLGEAEAIAPSAAFGTPTARAREHAGSLGRVTQFGTPSARHVLQAQSIGQRTRFGTPEQWGEHMTTGREHTAFGTPRAFNGKVCAAEGASSTQFGTPTATQTHIAEAMAPLARFGTPKVLRSVSC